MKRSFKLTLIRSSLPLLLIWLTGSPMRDRVEALTNASSAARTGVVIPLYIYPGPDWDRLIQVKNTYSRVPMIAVINPYNGPGTYQDLNYVTGIQNLRSAGITVLGYVYTNYAARSTEDVTADINAYKNWYALDGIFFDEMSNLAGNESYYSNLSNYAKSLGYQLTMGNPATDTLPSYIGTVDSLIISEGTGYPDLSFFGGWHTNYAKANFGL